MRVKDFYHGLLGPKNSDLAFVSKNGARIVNYSGLQAFDANGATLQAWFEIADGIVFVCVNDKGAKYPVLIDPIAQQAYLKASNTDPSDSFGRSVAASGRTVVIGAPLEDSGATGVNGNQFNNGVIWSGAAYVFVQDKQGQWSQQAYLKASNTGQNDQFGDSVAISEDTIVVGAPWEDSGAVGVNGNGDDNSAIDSGAAYVFVRDGLGNWSQQAYLKASNTDMDDRFGNSVAVYGDIVVIGAMREYSSATGVNGNQFDNSAGIAGAAYVFVRDEQGQWSQQAYLKASNTDAGDGFGQSVTVSGTTVIVGANGEDSNATGVNGDQAANNFGNSGAAYVFVRDAMSSWSQQAYLKPSNTGSGDYFGYSVSACGDTVIIGASLESSNSTGVNGGQGNNSATFSGAAYVFARNGETWSQQAYLKPLNTSSDDQFGYSVALSNDTAVVGARYEDSRAVGLNGNGADNSLANPGAAYVFSRDSLGQWTQSHYLKASNTGPGDYFGLSVAVSGETVIVGALGEDSNATGVNGNQADESASASGAVYCYPLADSDLDGVLDVIDLCPLNNPGLPVGPNGRPLFDCNSDCQYDGADLQCLVDALLDQ